MKSWLLALCLAWPTLALAAEPYVKLEQRLTAEQMRQTGLSQLTAEQLARLNELLASEQAAPAAADSHAAAVAGSSAVAATASEDRHETRGRDSLVGFSDEVIRSRLVGSVAGWSPGTVFVLENGQQWKVLKGEMKLSKPMNAPEVRVVPGVAGRWFLEVDEDTPKARVYRID